VTSFKCTVNETLSAFTLLCNHHNTEVCHLTKLTFCTHSTLTSCFPLPATPGNLYSIFYFFSPWWYWGLNAVLYHLSHSPRPFWLLLFFAKGLTFLPMPASDCDLPTYTSHITGISDVHHHTLLVCWNGGLTNFWPKPSSNLKPPSDSPVAGNIGVNQCAQPLF
jgi:hypothetical protein